MSEPKEKMLRGQLREALRAGHLREVRAWISIMEKKGLSPEDEYNQAREEVLRWVIRHPDPPPTYAELPTARDVEPTPYRRLPREEPEPFSEEGLLKLGFVKLSRLESLEYLEAEGRLSPQEEAELASARMAAREDRGLLSFIRRVIRSKQGS